MAYAITLDSNVYGVVLYYRELDLAVELRINVFEMSSLSI